jgi:hypothetical protein
MSRIVFLLAVLAISLTLGAPDATAGTEMAFNHNYTWLRDADGDGIPNCEDEDWTSPGDGTGYGLRHGLVLVLPGMFLSPTEDGNMYRKQKRNRYDREGDCDGDMDRQRLRDGSCQ